MTEIKQSLALLKTAVKAAKEEFPDESLWETYKPFDSAEEAEKEWGNIGKLSKTLDKPMMTLIEKLIKSYVPAFWRCRTIIKTWVSVSMNWLIESRH